MTYMEPESIGMVSVSTYLGYMYNPLIILIYSCKLLGHMASEMNASCPGSRACTASNIDLSSSSSRMCRLAIQMHVIQTSKGLHLDAVSISMCLSYITILLS